MLPLQPPSLGMRGPGLGSRAPLHPGRPAGELQRELLRELVASNPGLHVLRAAALLGLNWNTCLHHVRRLEGAGQVTVRKVNGRLCLFDNREGAVAPHLAQLLLREDRNAELARTILERPGLNQKALAALLGIAESVVHRRLLRLEAAGLVERVPCSRSVAVHATSALESAWAVQGPADDASPVGPPLAFAPAAEAGPFAVATALPQGPEPLAGVA